MRPRPPRHPDAQGVHAEEKLTDAGEFLGAHLQRRPRRDVQRARPAIGAVRLHRQLGGGQQAQGYTDGSAQQNDFGLYDGSFQLVLTDKDYEGGDRISIPTHENAFQEVRCNDEVDREQGVIHRVTYTSTVVEGVLNDNADAAYAKCAGSVGPASVNYLGGRTVEQGGRGYYSYRYVASVKTHTEDIPLSTTDGSGHVMGAGA